MIDHPTTFNRFETVERILGRAVELHRMVNARADFSTILMEARIMEAMLKTFIEAHEEK